MLIFKCVMTGGGSTQGVGEQAGKRLKEIGPVRVFVRELVSDLKHLFLPHPLHKGTVG